MSADGDHIRELAARVAALAEIATDEAARVASRGGVEWHSSGAERFRDRLRARADDYRSCADDLHGLRHSLLVHADQVDERHNLLAAVAEALT